MSMLCHYQPPLLSLSQVTTHHRTQTEDKKATIITIESPLTLPSIAALFVKLPLKAEKQKKRAQIEWRELDSKASFSLGMKVPISSSQQSTNSPIPRPVASNNTARNTTNFHISSAPIPSALSYEPTSVDLQYSPNSPPPPPPPPSSSVVPDLLSVTGGNNPAVDLDNLEGWDSILTELGLNDDSAPNSKILSHINPCTDSSQLPHLPELPTPQPFDHTPLITADLNNLGNDFSNYNQNLSSNNLYQFENSQNFGFDFLDDLIRAAQSFESNDLQQVQLILARLNQRLRSPVGKPLQRAAFYFKEALQSLVTSGSGRPVRLSSYDIVQTIRAYKAFSGISPVPLFSTFAANQAILEAIAAAAFVHIIDFDIGFGGHWASLMRELVDKAGSQGKVNSIVLRITAVVPEEFGIESKLVRENLAQFARELNINFHVEYVLIRSFEILSFKSIKFMQGEKIAVHLSPTIFQRLGSRSHISKFVAELRSLAPSVITMVDREAGIDTGRSAFGLNFVAGLEFYVAMMESLDAASAGGFVIAGSEWVRKVENYLLRPRIMAAVESAGGGRKGAPWREMFLAGGMKAAYFSQFADFQAECLLRRAQIGGFHMEKRHEAMVLCWHDRPLVSTSAWRC